ncbi:hypothetical protein [Pseudomonas citronellolis]|uniref:hypothetical protein n=1 Tax=Pseudomonas citronellolis TaxID=53408 RepID=UPI00108174B1|nr:hypothetical protein [Pseudomonas citronellolis]UUC49976.1 hypothetical protein NOX82_29610 [Pseudomonas citronellolis]
MTESYEVVFQQVAVGDLLELLNAIEVSSEVLSDLGVSESLGDILLAEIDKKLIDGIVSYEGDICLTGRLYKFNVSNEICLPFVFLRVIKYANGIDVELSFDDTRLFDIGGLMRVMQIYADGLSKKINMVGFYGGLEPAIDIDTRYFTGDVLGPLG